MRLHLKHLLILIFIYLGQSSWIFAADSKNLCRSYFVQSEVLNLFSLNEKSSLEAAAQQLADLIGTTDAQNVSAKRHLNTSIQKNVKRKNLSQEEILIFQSWLISRIQFHIESKKEAAAKRAMQARLQSETFKKQKNAFEKTIRAERRKIKLLKEKYEAQSLTEILIKATDAKTASDAPPTRIKDIFFVLKRFEQLELSDRAFRAVVQHDHLQAVEYFLRNGIQLDTKNFMDQFPLHIAAENNPNPEIIRRLIQAVPSSQLNSVDTQGWSPLHYAASSSTSEVVRVLVDAGADATLLGKGRTPMNLAAENLKINSSTFEMLIEKGGRADIHLKGKWGATPLMKAVNYLNIEAVKVLLKAGVDPSIKDDFNSTALHIAADAFKCPVEMLTLLLNAGADPTMRNNDHRTPYDIVRISRANWDLSPEDRTKKIQLLRDAIEEWKRTHP